MSETTTSPSGQPSEFARRLLATLAAVAAAVVVMFVLWRVFDVLLVVFAGVLLGIFLDGITRFVVRHTTLTRRLAYGLVVGLLTGLAIGFGLWIAPDVAEQFQQLRDQIPQAVASVRAWLAERGWLSQVDALDVPERIVSVGLGAGGLTGVFSTVFGLIGNMVLALFVGVITAARPDLYVGAFMHLVPPAHRGEAQHVLSCVGQAMRQWLIGRLISMIVIAVGTSVGLLIIGIPLWLALGLLAGLLEFIPYVGPLVACVPAILIGLLHDPSTGLHVLLLFAGVQFAESYLLTPFVEQYVVSIPAAFLVAVQACMAVTLGLVGVLLATPVTVLVVVLVQLLYVRRVLGDEVTVAGTRSPEPRAPPEPSPPGHPEPA